MEGGGGEIHNVPQFNLDNFFELLSKNYRVKFRMYRSPLHSIFNNYYESFFHLLQQNSPTSYRSNTHDELALIPMIQEHVYVSEGDLIRFKCKTGIIFDVHVYDRNDFISLPFKELYFRNILYHEEFDEVTLSLRNYQTSETVRLAGSLLVYMKEVQRLFRIWINEPQTKATENINENLKRITEQIHLVDVALDKNFMLLSEKAHLTYEEQKDIDNRYNLIK